MANLELFEDQERVDGERLYLFEMEGQGNVRNQGVGCHYVSMAGKEE